MLVALCDPQQYLMFLAFTLIFFIVCPHATAAALYSYLIVFLLLFNSFLFSSIFKYNGTSFHLCLTSQEFAFAQLILFLLLLLEATLSYTLRLFS